MTKPREAAADIVVLTALGLEYEAVRRHLIDVWPRLDTYGTHYLVGRLEGGPDQVALALIGEGNLTAAVLAGRAIEEFAPRALMLVGVAGGLADDIALGDVVVGSRLIAYHSGREGVDGFRPRPKSWPLAHVLEQQAREVAHEGHWHRQADARPAVHFKPIVSGEVLLDSRSSPLAGLIAEHYGDAGAIDMESAGVAEAAHRKDFHRAVTIRGISDFADGGKRRMDEEGWQPRAAVHAAAFAAALARRICGQPAEPGLATACPYRGLAAFREEDCDLFFGREELAGELADLVCANRFVAVAGRSGCGKSSLISAGLIPRMRARGWANAAFRAMPGVPAATALAGGLLPLLAPGLNRVDAISHRTLLAQAITAGRLPEIVAEVLAESRATRLLVSVDQFEEFIAYNEEAARELCGLLVNLAGSPAAAHVVLTMRTESLDLAVNRLGLGEVTRHSVFLVTPMQSPQLRAVIEAPLEPTGVSFEPGLVERILESAEDAPAALFLTQFALTRLWEQQSRRRLTHAAYEGFGGVAGAVADYAEQVWTADLDHFERVQAHRLLLQLVRTDSAGEAVRRTARGSELEAELVPIARRLATTRLVVTGMDGTETTYDLAHAALVRHWQRLGDWLNEKREFRAWQEDLRESIRRAEPLRGPRLVRALRWIAEHPRDISASERGFISASRRAHRVRSTAWRGGVAVIVLLLVLVSTIAVSLRRESRETARQLRRNAAHLLIAQSLDRFSGDPATAALMAVAAYRANPDPAVQAHLAGEYLRYRSTTRLLSPGIGTVHQVELSADGKVLAALGSGVALWRLDQPAAPPQRYGHDLRRIAISPDGRLVAGSTAQGRVEVRQPDGAVVVLDKARSGGGAAENLRFDRDGRRLLAFLPKGGLRVWDLRRRASIPVPAAAGRQARKSPGRLWFGPDDDSIIIGGDRELVIWDLPTRKATTLANLSVPIVSGDGRTAVSCNGLISALSVWDLTKRRRRVEYHHAGCTSTSLDSDLDHFGKLMIVAAAPEGDDAPSRRDASLLRLDTGTTAHPVTPSIPPTYEVHRKVAITPGGTRLVSSAGSSVAVVDLTAADFRPINQLSFTTDYNVRVFSDDLRLVATRYQMFRLQLWDTDTGRRIADVPNPAGDSPIRFSADGRAVLVRSKSAEYLEVRQVPSLRVTARLPLPVTSGARTTLAGNPDAFVGTCPRPVPGTGTMALAAGGMISRFDLRAGAQIGRPLQPWQGQSDLAVLAQHFACAVRPGHNEIAVAVGTKVELRNLATGRRTAQLPVADPTGVADLRFTPSGRLLAILDRDSTLEIWDLAKNRRVLSRLPVLPPFPYNTIVAFPADDRIIVRDPARTRIWDLDRRAMIANLDITGDRIAASDGRSLLHWSAKALVRLPVEARQWTAHLCRIVGRDFTDAERKALPAGVPRTGPCT